MLAVKSPLPAAHTRGLLPVHQYPRPTNLYTNYYISISIPGFVKLWRLCLQPHAGRALPRASVNSLVALLDPACAGKLASILRPDDRLSGGGSGGGTADAGWDPDVHPLLFARGEALAALALMLNEKQGTCCKREAAAALSPRLVAALGDQQLAGAAEFVRPGTCALVAAGALRGAQGGSRAERELLTLALAQLLLAVVATLRLDSELTEQHLEPSDTATRRAMDQQHAAAALLGAIAACGADAAQLAPRPGQLRVATRLAMTVQRQLRNILRLLETRAPSASMAPSARSAAIAHCNTLTRGAATMAPRLATVLRGMCRLLSAAVDTRAATAAAAGGEAAAKEAAAEVKEATQAAASILAELAQLLPRHPVVATVLYTMAHSGSGGSGPVCPAPMAALLPRLNPPYISGMASMLAAKASGGISFSSGGGGAVGQLAATAALLQALAPTLPPARRGSDVVQLYIVDACVGMLSYARELGQDSGNESRAAEVSLCQLGKCHKERKKKHPATSCWFCMVLLQ